ncbi:DMT family transporter [Kribbella sp. CA-293567]|uniref:DMT family transporter n=1 Tax=Kribbella sp. CA-293567 TaxID=3002436 RepID=UPI0022DD23D8|nr:DMT family transporter [Kribbella sp. CA-293567]WBQ07504.1 DMT family transporter [Kribbella sp. CA-293567]
MRRSELPLVGLAALGGVGLAVQARLNGDLGASLGDGIVASMISTGTGILLLLAIVPTSRGGRRALRQLREALRVQGLRWWQCLGGVSGALYVVSQGVSVSSLGVGIFVVAVVGGTSAGSLAVDRVGLGPGGPLPITARRVTGATTGVVAIAIAGQDQLTGDSSLWLLALPVAAGLALSVQSALNARVGAIAGSPWAAALVNFVVAGCTLCIALPIEILIRGGGPPGRLPAEPWLYCGGFIGVAIIAIATTVVRRLGVLVFGLVSIVGQLLGAVLLDVFGAHRPPVTTWLAIALTLGAVAVTMLPVKPQPPRAG